VRFAAAAAPVLLDESLTPPLTKACPFLEQKDPEQVRREVQHQPEFEATMEASRQLLEERHLAKDAVGHKHKLLMELLEQPRVEQPAAEKAKEAEAFTCKYKGCNGKYTDARGSGGTSKRNYGFCRNLQ
jgi:hypothetical protein